MVGPANEQFIVSKSSSPMRVELLGSLDGDDAFELGNVFDALVLEKEPVTIYVAAPDVSLLGWAVVERAVRRFARDRVSLDLHIGGDPWPAARREAVAILQALEAFSSATGNEDSPG